MAADSESHVDGTTVLGEDDLRDVRLAVADLAARWKDLGISLGIHLSEVDAIFSAYPCSPNDCLREILALWLKQNYNVERFGKPTWRRLVEAVKDPVGGNHCALAQKIARDYPDVPDKEYRKLESQQQSRLCPEKGLESNDCTDVFSLPQYIQVIVSNYQLLQRVFAIPKGECQSGEIKTEEQFSPTVTIVDTATQQPLDCLLLLHGEKPPDVSCRTLFCYIAVEVTYCEEHGSPPHPLYHMESKPCKQGKLPLTFCFHQPGRACNIQLSIHSIVDSERVEYMYHSADRTCVVEIINREEHRCVSDVHGVERVKEPPLIRYTGPLASERFHQLEQHFTRLLLSPTYEKIQQTSKQILDESSISLDIKVYALCWKVLSEAILENYVHERYEGLLETAWRLATQMKCKNSLLLQGKIKKDLAYLYYAKGNDCKALEYISQAKEIMSIAAPSKETAFTLHTDLRIKRRALFSKHQPFSSELYTSTEKEYERLLEHAKHMEEYEKPTVFNFYVMKASFHLRSDLITDDLPPDEYWPSPDDLLKAEECLKNVSLASQSNFYTARYYCVLCDLHIWKKQYPEAMHYLRKAIKEYDQQKLDAMRRRTCMPVNKRLQLLEKIMGDEKIDEILMKSSM